MGYYVEDNMPGFGEAYYEPNSYSGDYSASGYGSDVPGDQQSYDGESGAEPGGESGAEPGGESGAESGGGESGAESGGGEASGGGAESGGGEASAGGDVSTGGGGGADNAQP